MHLSQHYISTMHSQEERYGNPSRSPTHNTARSSASDRDRFGFQIKRPSRPFLWQLICRRSPCMQKYREIGLALDCLGRCKCPATFLFLEVDGNTDETVWSKSRTDLLWSRPDPHKRLKKFLSPAFTIAYVDGLEFLFSKCVGDLINRYVDLLSCPSPKGEKAPVVTDLMEDLHSLALDM